MKAIVIAVFFFISLSSRACILVNPGDQGELINVFVCALSMINNSKNLEQEEAKRKIYSSFVKDDFKNCKRVGTVKTHKEAPIWKRSTSRCSELVKNLVIEASKYSEVNALFISLTHYECKARKTTGIMYNCDEPLHKKNDEEK